MAISAATVWEVRPTVGSDTNGAGFVAGASGTDYSQQNSKNTVGNNISTTDVVATGIATITSASASFTAAIVGNIIYLSGTGVTTGWYQVVTFTNVTTIILDRSPGTFTGATINIGGALATILTSAPPFVSSNTIWIKNSGTMTVGASLSLASSLNSIIFSGYTTTRGDGGQITWTTATNSTSLLGFSSNVNSIQFNNIYFSNTATVRAQCCPSPSSGVAAIQFSNCVFDGFTTAIDGNFNENFQYDRLILVNTEIKNCSVYGVQNSGATYMLGCYIHACTTAGMYVIRPTNTPTYQFERTVFASCGIGLLLDSDQNLTLAVNNCTFYSNTTAGIAKNNNGQGGPQQIWNSIFYGNGTYGIDYNTFAVTSMVPSVFNNAFGSNGTANRRGYSFGSSTDISLSANPFNVPASDDFSLNSVAGGGTACKAAGYQGVLNGALTSGNSIDVGPVQSAGSGGGGGTTTNYIVSKNVTQVFVEDY